MASITLRSVKGAPLSNTEVDNNFNNLNTDKLESSAYTASDVLTKIKTVDGVTSGLDADLLQAKSPATAATADTIALRGALGVLDVGTPTTAAHATTKTYVDNLVPTKSTNVAGGLGGQILYQSAVDTTAKLANGTAGQVLQSNGTTIAPSWVTPSGAASTDDTTTNATYYPGIYTAAGGSTLKTSSTKLTFNPSTGTLSATVFAGPVTGLKSATTTVAVDAATAPTNGQALIATSSTTATWQTLAGAASTDDTTTNATYYPGVYTTAGGTTLKTSSTKLTFNPSTGTLSATSLNSLSDQTLKTNVATLTNAVDKVSSLRGVAFDWLDGSGSSYGFIAQEVQPVLPNAVAPMNDNLAVNYSSIIPFLVEAIKEQQKEINSLKALLQ